MPAMLMVHEEDPAEKIFKALGKRLGEIEIFNNHVLLGVYERPKQTKSGLHLPDDYRDEDKHQGKACVILKIAQAAFNDPDGRWFVKESKDDGLITVREEFKVGDWIAIRPSDGFPMTIIGSSGEKVFCRMVHDTAVRMRIPAPDVIW